MSWRDLIVATVAALFASATHATIASCQSSDNRVKAFAAITVANLDSSEAWYAKHLGTSRISSSRAPSGIAENAVVANDYLILELIHFTATAPSDTALVANRDIGLKKVGMWVDSATFTNALAHLQKLGARFVGGVMIDEKIRARSFIVKDNSGVLVQFFTAAIGSP